MKAERPYAGYFLATVGVIGLLLEITLHVWTSIRHVFGIPGEIYELNHWVLIVMTALGFVGWYLIRPKSAEEGTDILTKRAVEIIIAIRSGRRGTDQFTAVIPPTVKPGDAVVVAKPNPPPHPDGAPPAPTDDERVELAPNG
jgi:hypothetical protein